MGAGAKIKSTGKLLLLKFAAEFVGKVNALPDKACISHTMKDMIQTGMSLNVIFLRGETSAVLQPLGNLREVSKSREWRTN